MRVLVSGASGMIGSAITDALRERGDEVGALVRHGRPSTGLDVAWDPARGTLDHEALAAGSYDAVLHLAGEPLLGRWTDEKKERMLASRVDGTTLLATALAALEQRPECLLVASATGWYGDRGEELLTEESAPGHDYVASIVDAWEQSAEPARAAGIRTAHLRMAPVQSRDGGALKELLLPFRLGVGGRVGNGRQWAPWIGLEEVVRAWLFAIDTTELSGVVNVVGPTPCRNAEYVRALGRVLGRPTIIPAPMPIVRMLYGRQLVDEMLLTSQKVVPARLEGLGYEFIDRTIEAALRRELDR